jgi:hypothetical protein
LTMAIKNIAKQILKAALKGIPAVLFIFDCIGSKSGSLGHIAKIAQRGTRVAVLLPVTLKEATDAEALYYSMNAQEHAKWQGGVGVRGVRTHF